MALLHYFWLFSIITAQYFIFSTDAEKAFVTPSKNVTCPSQPCLTFSDYAREPNQYFKNNTTFMFLSGIHQLDIQLTLENVSDLTFLVSDKVWDDTVQVFLNPLVNITWINCDSIEVSGLVFVLGGKSDGEFFSALVFHKTTSFLSNLTLIGNRTLQSTAILLNDSSQVKVNNMEAKGATSTNGAAIYAHNSTIDFLGQNIFVNNTATSDGGAIVLDHCISNVYGNILFVNNTANGSGGAVSLTGGSCSISGNISFVKNTVTQGLGGAMYITGGIHTLLGNISFVNNTATQGFGGAMSLVGGVQSIFGEISFVNNVATFGGAIMLTSGVLNISGNVSFINNAAPNGFGGAMSLTEGIQNVFGNISFVKNTASFGSALSITGGNYTFSGNISFVNNTGPGSAMSVYDGIHNTSGNSDRGDASYSTHVELGKVRFEGNAGGAIFLSGSYLHISTSEFVKNTAFTVDDNTTSGGAIHAEDSTVNMTGTQSFIQNSALQGGAMAFSGNSKLILTQPLQLNFKANLATTNGGAIFYDDVIPPSQCTRSSNHEECFIELSSSFNIHLNFSNNTAGSSGSLVYGGNLDGCRLYVGGGERDNCGNRIGGNYSDNPVDTIKTISSTVSVDSTTSDFSSDPIQVCICILNDSPMCNVDMDIETVRGKEFSVQVVTVGQNNGIVPSSVRTSLSNGVQISPTQRIQSTGKNCTPIVYRLSSEYNTTTLELFPDSGSCRDIESYRTNVNVKFLPCPDGFTLKGSECVCEDRLQQYTTSCSVDTDTIERSSNTFWMGTVYNNKTFEGLILHSGCPFDYCTDTPVSIKLNNLDIQCNHNHSGTLCGSCSNNYSIAFGTLHCLPCSNDYLALILPFALAGIALVAVLLLLKLSVATGIVNGLVFYANVIQANRSIFFPPGKTNILTVFIAWMNLDLGIETCFYDGMNAYAFTWLQFLFPFYVWFLIGLIIVMSHCSNTIARSLGKNPVTVLATLFLLSYSKILRTVITALSVTSLEYPDGSRKLVWLYDGSVPYFQRADHILLGSFAVIALVLLFLPYTLLLLCGHWLQAYSHWWILSWLNKIKPFMDAYHAPYKKETRYWTGLILIVRCALLLTFALNTLGNANVDLLVTTSVTAGLLAWMHHNVYERLYNNVLETSFILNLCIFAAATYHVKETGGSQAVLAFTFVGIAFATFICIVLYHIYLCLCKTSVWKKLPKPNTEKYFIVQWFGKNKESDANEDGESDDEQENDAMQAPTSTIVQLRESLLEK